MMARFIDLGHPLHRTKHFFLSQLTNFWKLHTDITELCLTNHELMTFVTNLLIKTRFVKHSVCSFNWLTVYWSRRDDYLALNVASCATLTQPFATNFFSLSRNLSFNMAPWQFSFCPPFDTGSWLCAVTCHPQNIKIENKSVWPPRRAKPPVLIWSGHKLVLISILPPWLVVFFIK